MALAIVHSRALVGLQAPRVSVEVHLSGGLPSLTIVGLPATAVREARDRVRAALQNSGFKVPPRRITVNLAPADLPKDGGRFDLAIALGILLATGQLKGDVENREFLAELSLSGELRPVRGILPSALAVAVDQAELIVSRENGPEAALARSLNLRSADTLLAVCAALSGEAELEKPRAMHRKPQPGTVADLADVRGQSGARRALEIAAAGGHSLLFSGPPGCGKSMLAQRLPGILPALTDAQALEVAAINSISTGRAPHCWGQRPFRAPHHTASAVALVGGGSSPKPGEVSLAHHGVLFLDELPEFSRHGLEVLREPMETGQILISRATRQAEYPARFQLIAAMNPCPCGWLGDRGGACRCSSEQVSRYRTRVSGPLLDRIDIQLSVGRPERDLLLNPAAQGEPSADVAARVAGARERQQARGSLNAVLAGDDLDQHCAMSPAVRNLIEAAMQKLNLSARALHRVQRVSRTIADLAGSEHIQPSHAAEAIQLRQLDRR